MIVLRNLTKTFSIEGVRKTVADNINATFPTGVSVGLLGRNGAGKSTLLKLIAGTSTPTRGEVLSSGSVSFPVGLASSLHNDLTGAQNTRFVARIYGADTDALMDWVEDFAELGAHFHLPVRSYSSGMRGRLSFGINMGLAFDTYLIDEVTAVGDATFRKKSSAVFKARMEKAGAIFISHSMGQIRDLCQAGALLEDGKLAYYEDVDEAIERYLYSLDQPGPKGTVPAGPQEDDEPARLPGGTRLLYGLGLPATHADWVAAALRAHEGCFFPATPEPHYFDVRAGRGAAVPRARAEALETLAARRMVAEGTERARVLREAAELDALMRMHAAPPDGHARHDAYLSYMRRGWKDQPVLCDVTPAYARLRRQDFAEMAGLGGTFLIVLRDPVARFWEALCLERPEEARSQAACLGQLDALLASPEDVALLRPDANYARALSRLEAEAGRDAPVVLFHERLEAEGTRAIELARMTAALRLPPVAPERVPPLPAPPAVPPLPEARAAALEAALAPQYEAMRARFGAVLPATWRGGPLGAGRPAAG